MSGPYVNAHEHKASKGSRNEWPSGVIVYSTPIGAVGNTVRVTSPLLSLIHI